MTAQTKASTRNKKNTSLEFKHGKGKETTDQPTLETRVYNYRAHTTKRKRKKRGGLLMAHALRGITQDALLKKTCFW